MRELVLVTGGAGFIGSHLSEALLDRGYRVRVLDNLSFGRRDWVPAEAEFVEGDIRDLGTCRAAVHGCTGVFHMAAMSRSAASLTAIESCTENNVLGTQNILVAAREHNIRKLVYSGSSTYYGSQPVPHTEAMRPDFLNMYGLTKYIGEEYCLLFDRLYNTPAIVLRYFNVYGPRQPETGAYALVLGVFLRRWAEGQPLEIHGDGSQRRDFIHVRDVASANIAAYESWAHGSVFNRPSPPSTAHRRCGHDARRHQPDPIGPWLGATGSVCGGPAGAEGVDTRGARDRLTYGTLDPIALHRRTGLQRGRMPRRGRLRLARVPEIALRP